MATLFPVIDPEARVSNPFMKKNPYLSLWLSGANKVASTGRAHFMAAAKRQQAAMQREASKAVTDFWSEALKPAATRKRKTSAKK